MNNDLLQKKKTAFYTSKWFFHSCGTLAFLIFGGVHDLAFLCLSARTSGRHAYLANHLCHDSPVSGRTGSRSDRIERASAVRGRAWMVPDFKLSVYLVHLTCIRWSDAGTASPIHRTRSASGWLCRTLLCRSPTTGRPSWSLGPDEYRSASLCKRCLDPLGFSDNSRTVTSNILLQTEIKKQPGPCDPGC